MLFVGFAYSRNKLALRTRTRNLKLKSQFSIFDSFRDIRVQIYGFWDLWWSWQNFWVIR